MNKPSSIATIAIVIGIALIMVSVSNLLISDRLSTAEETTINLQEQLDTALQDIEILEQTAVTQEEIVYTLSTKVNDVVDKYDDLVDEWHDVEADINRYITVLDDVRMELGIGLG